MVVKILKEILLFCINNFFLFFFLITGHPKISSTLVRDKFHSLVQTHFIQRCLTPVRDTSGKVVSLGTAEDVEIRHVIPDS